METSHRRQTSYSESIGSTLSLSDKKDNVNVNEESDEFNFASTSIMGEEQFGEGGLFSHRKKIYNLLKEYHESIEGLPIDNLDSLIKKLDFLKEIEKECNNYLALGKKIKHSDYGRQLKSQINNEFLKIKQYITEEFNTYLDGNFKCDSYEKYHIIRIAYENLCKRISEFKDKTKDNETKVDCIELDRKLGEMKNKIESSDATGLKSIEASILQDEMAKYGEEELSRKILEELIETGKSVDYEHTDSIEANTRVNAAREDETKPKYTIIQTLSTEATESKIKNNFIHELTHAANGDTFNAYKLTAFPMDRMKKQEELKYIRKTLEYRSMLAKGIFDKYINLLLDISPEQQKKLNIIQISLTYIRDEVGENGRIRKDWMKINGIKNSGEKPSEAQKGFGIDNIIGNEQAYKSYEIIGEDSKDTIYNNSIIEYDSVINEVYFFLKDIDDEGIKGNPNYEPLLEAVTEAAEEAYNYRKIYRDSKDFEKLKEYIDTNYKDE